MKYLIVIFLYLLSPPTNTLALENDSLIILPFIDSINHTDKSGLKQGFWAYSGIPYIGNCTNESISYYTYFQDNKMQMKVMFLHDSNACYPPQHLFHCTILDDQEKIIFTFANNSLTPVLKGYFKTENIEFNSNINHSQFSRNLIIENLTKKKYSQWKQRIPRRPKFTYLSRKLVGQYYIYENGEPYKEFSIK